MYIIYSIYLLPSYGLSIINSKMKNEFYDIKKVYNLINLNKCRKITEMQAVVIYSIYIVMEVYTISPLDIPYA